MLHYLQYLDCLQSSFYTVGITSKIITPYSPPGAKDTFLPFTTNFTVSGYSINSMIGFGILQRWLPSPLWFTFISNSRAPFFQRDIKLHM